MRTDLKPLLITQPEGSSFTVDGTELKWQNWTMRLGFNYREGPVIYQVSFDDKGTKRDVAYRMSFAEMIVPYRDPSFDHYRRTAYDIGEWGLGCMTTSLELGCDCPVRSPMSTPPWPTPKASLSTSSRRSACMKKTTQSGGSTSITERVRRCVVSVAWWCPATPPWRTTSTWCTGASIRTATSSARSGRPASWSPPRCSRGDPPPYGTVVDKNTYAPYHQHFLVARFDLDVDGDENTVMEVDSFAPPVSEENPYGLALVTKATPIKSESESARDFDWSTQRSWKVVNPNKQNKVGTDVSYKLVPGHASRR